jgi:hypothetical protein
MRETRTSLTFEGEIWKVPTFVALEKKELTAEHNRYKKSEQLKLYLLIL